MSISEINSFSSFTPVAPLQTPPIDEVQDETPAFVLSENDRILLRSLNASFPVSPVFTLLEFIVCHLNATIETHTKDEETKYLVKYQQFMLDFMNLAVEQSEGCASAFWDSANILLYQIKREQGVLKRTRPGEGININETLVKKIVQLIELCQRLARNIDALFLPVEEADAIKWKRPTYEADDNTNIFLKCIKSCRSSDVSFEKVEQYRSTLTQKYQDYSEKLKLKQAQEDEILDASTTLRTEGVIPPELSTTSEASFEEGDLWAKFVAEKIVSAGFSLSPKSEDAIRQILQDNPLNDGLTLYDAIGFALYKVLKQLNSFACHKEGFKLSEEANNYYYSLLLGMFRYDGQSKLGYVNDYTLKYFLGPNEVLDPLKNALRFFNSAKFPKKQLEKYNLALQQLAQIQTLLKEILDSQQRLALLTNSLYFFPISSNAKIVCVGFWVFFFFGFVGFVKTFGVDPKIFSKGKLEEIGLLFKGFSQRKPKNHDIFSLRKSLKMFLISNAQRLALANEVVTQIYQGRLTQQGFLEQQLQNVLFFKAIQSTVGPLIYMTYDQLNSDPSTHIKNTGHRLMANLNAFTEERTQPLGNALPDKIERILFGLFKPVVDLISRNRRNVMTNINQIDGGYASQEELGALLMALSGVSSEVEKVYNHLLLSLEKFPKNALQAVKTHYKECSKEELLLLNREEIQKQIFDKGYKFLFDFFILQDILSITGRLEFVEEQDLIPSPLANALKLDGVDQIIDALIKAKPHPQPALKEEPEEHASGEKLFSGRKIREVLEKLNELGFFEIRQKGSHIVLKNPELGRTVVVPKHSEIKDGTLHSIGKQAQGGLNN